MNLAGQSSTSRSAARLPVQLALAIFILTLLATFALWRNAQNQAEQELRSDFQAQAQLAVRRIELRMETYEQVARSTQSFLLASSDVTRENFHIFIKALRLDEKFPGIQGISLVEAIPKQTLDTHSERVRNAGFPNYIVHPEGIREQYSSIVQIEPFTEVNQRALGFDMLTSPVRRAAMEKARDTGQAAASGKVTLIQENNSVSQPGLIMYFPVYKRGMQTDTVEQRQTALVEWVGVVFRMNDLMARLRIERNNDVSLTIYDNGQVSEETVLYDSINDENVLKKHQAKFEFKQLISVGGRPWAVHVKSRSIFESRLEKGEPRFLAAAGSMTSLILALLVWTLASSRRHALTLANTMTRQLRDSNARLHSEEQRIRVILDNAHDAFIALDLDGRITDWNAKAETTFGWAANEVVGKDFAEVCISPEHRKAHRAWFERFMVPDSPAHRSVVEVEGLHRSGQTIPLELAFASVPTNSGYAVSSFVRDISERKEAQRKVAARTKALEDTRAALHQAQKMESLGNLTGGVAHDFNNVLQVISGNIQLIQRLYPHEGPLKPRLVGMLAATERGAKLSAQLLAYARLQPLKPEVVSLGVTIENLEEFLKPALGNAVSLRTIVAENLWNTEIDRDKLENVILNLAINSRDAMPNGGQIVIEMSNVVVSEDDIALQAEVSPGEYVLIRVSDNGKGMSEEVRVQAFEPFYTTKPIGQGTGLGLSMVYGFVKQSGGYLYIKSEIGIGTCINLFLPRSDKAPNLGTQNGKVPVTGGQEKILVVEDELDVRNTAVTMLEGLGYHIVAAETGEEALKILTSGIKFDLLFTDVVMPGPVSSTALAKQAKQLLPELKILFTSGYSYNALIIDGRLERGVNLLSKPYRHDELAMKIRQVLDDADAL